MAIEERPGAEQELVKDAHFYCKNCGRAAHNGENLCNQYVGNIEFV